MNPMVALDTHYRAQATTAAVLFEKWSDAIPLACQISHCQEVGEYRSGSFFLRELPSLLQALKNLEPSLIVVDGYVHLGQSPGLGWHLYQALGQKCPIIGVAKNPYRSAPGIPLFRGSSTRPLFLSALGVDEQQAARWVGSMHGTHRIPTLLALADRLSRC